MAAERENEKAFGGLPLAASAQKNSRKNRKKTKPRCAPMKCAGKPKSARVRRKPTGFIKNRKANGSNGKRRSGEKPLWKMKSAKIDQSAKALQVMLEELRDHGTRRAPCAQNRSTNDQVLVSLKGNLAVAAHGRIVQNFGRQYPDGLNQLVVSNGIKIEAGQNHTVRTIQEGKSAFRQRLPAIWTLVIVQHKSGLTSVYAGLGQTQVKEGQMLAALDQIGITGDKGSFYFELRRDEQRSTPWCI